MVSRCPGYYFDSVAAFVVPILTPQKARDKEGTSVNSFHASRFSRPTLDEVPRIFFGVAMVPCHTVAHEGWR